MTTYEKTPEGERFFNQITVLEQLHTKMEEHDAKMEELEAGLRAARSRADEARAAASAAEDELARGHAAVEGLKKEAGAGGASYGALAARYQELARSAERVDVTAAEFKAATADLDAAEKSTKDRLLLAESDAREVSEGQGKFYNAVDVRACVDRLAARVSALRAAAAANEEKFRKQEDNMFASLEPVVVLDDKNSNGGVAKNDEIEEAKIEDAEEMEIEGAEEPRNEENEEVKETAAADELVYYFRVVDEEAKKTLCARASAFPNQVGQAKKRGPGCLGCTMNDHGIQDCEAADALLVRECMQMVNFSFLLANEDDADAMNKFFHGRNAPREEGACPCGAFPNNMAKHQREASCPYGTVFTFLFMLHDNNDMFKMFLVDKKKVEKLGVSTKRRRLDEPLETGPTIVRKNKETVDALVARLAELQQAQARADAETGRLRAKIEEQDATIERLRGKFDEQTERIASLEDELRESRVVVEKPFIRYGFETADKVVGIPPKNLLNFLK